MKWIKCFWLHRHFKCWGTNGPTGFWNELTGWHCSYCEFCHVDINDPEMTAIFGGREAVLADKKRHQEHCDDLIKRGIMPRWWSK